MVQFLGISDYVVLALVLVMSTCIGLYFRFTGGRQKTLDEFLLAGRNMATFPAAVSILATFLSAIAMLGRPAEVYLYGVQIYAMLLGFPLGYLLCAFGCLPIYFDLNVSTSYEYLEIRFGKIVRNIAAFIFILRAMFHTSLALYTPSLALNTVTGLSTWTSILTLTVVCSFYCSLGGLKAVIWTDVFQTVLMWIPLIAIAVNGILEIGFREIININTEGRRMMFFNTSFDLSERYTFWNSVLQGIYIVIEFNTTQQSQVQRLLSVGNYKNAKWSLFWAMVFISIFELFLFFTGLILYGIFHDCDPVQNPEVQLGSADQIFPYTLLKMFGGMLFLPGLCISGLYSGALSSVSSSLNAMADVTVEDFMKPYCKCSKFTPKWMSIVAKLLAIAFGCLSLLLVVIVSQFQGIMEAAYVLNGIYGGTFIGVYFLAMFTTTANEYGTVIGFFTGFVFNAWIGVGNYMSKNKIVTLPRSISGCTPSINESAYSSELYLNHINTLSIDTELKNITVLASDESRYAFPLYKLASLWMASSGLIVCVVVGYILSLLLGFWKDNPSVNPKCISPFVRRLYFISSDTEKSEHKMHHQVEMDQKQKMDNHTPNKGNSTKEF